MIQKSWYSGNLRRVVPEPQVLLFTGRKLHQLNRHISGTSSKRPPGASVSQLLCRLTACLLFHQLLQLWRLQKTQKRTLLTLNQQMKEISKWNTPLISFQPQYRNHNKRTTCKNLDEYRYYLIIQNIWSNVSQINRILL